MQQGYQQPGYQPYQQQAYQQLSYQQPVYQSYQQPQVQQSQAPQPQMPHRNRRMQQHAAQMENNVVDFGAYQQRQQPQQSQQPQPAQPQPVQENAAQPAGSLLSARVINARSMGDCRSAITLLRNGDAVLIVLENISDPSEMRRLVDTLSGACYSLTATITKLSRYGVYLLAPQTLAVFTDQATNAMNSAPVRTQARNYQPGYSGQRTTYTSQPMQGQPQMQPPQQQPQANNPYAGMQAFTQRAAAPEEAPQNFYQRPAPQAAQTPSFSAQPAGYGYAPDEVMAADQ